MCLVSIINLNVRPAFIETLNWNVEGIGTALSAARSYYAMHFIENFRYFYIKKDRILQSFLISESVADHLVLKA